VINKLWSIKNPLLGGALIASVLSQVAAAAELPSSQPAPTPGIPTPDQAVRRMATNVVLDSKSAAFLASSARTTGVGADRLSPRPIPALPTSSSILPTPSKVLSNCPANVCGFVATQPPVDLGTVAPSGIAQNKLPNFSDVTGSTPFKVQPDATRPQTSTPNDQITSAANASLSVEPGLSKDIAFGQPVTKSVSPTTTEPSSLPTVTEVIKSDQTMGIKQFQSQLTAFTGQFATNSWKLITVLPKPQLDSSLLNIGSSPFKLTDSSSFSSRLTLGSSVQPIKLPQKVISLSTSPFFAPQPGVKSAPVFPPFNLSGFFAQPLNTSNSKLHQFSMSNNFSAPSHFETSSKLFSIVTFLAVVNTSTMSVN
jgi:hypothetical protein